MKVLSYCLHPGIWSHAFPEALLLESLFKQGHEVKAAFCRGLLREGCICQISSNVAFDASDEEKDRCCADCLRHGEIIGSEMAIPFVAVDSFSRPEDKEEVASLLRLSDAELMQLKLDGIEIGRYALYEVLLQGQLLDTELSPEHSAAYRTLLSGAVLSFRAFQRIVEAEKPDRVCIFTTAYSANKGCMKYAESIGVPTYCLQSCANLATLYKRVTIGRSDLETLHADLLARWSEVKETPTSLSAATQVGDFLKLIFAARSPFTYSTGLSESFDTRKYFGINANQKIAVVSLSSYDESYSSYVTGGHSYERAFGTVYPSQVDWVRALIEFGRNRPDIFFILRVHPREFSGEKLSPHALLLKEVFEELPDNFKVNWPNDNVSLYDLAADMDVLLNSLSTAGTEMSLLGIPVVVYDKKLPDSPGEINYCGESEEEYFQNIDKALDDGWSLSHAIKMFRWLGLRYTGSTFDISQSFAYDGPQPPASQAKVVCDGVQCVRQELDCRNRAHTLPHANALVAMFENAAMSMPSGGDEMVPLSEDEEREIVWATVKDAVRSVGQDSFALYTRIVREHETISRQG